MKICYILFDGITLLDFVGIYDPISRIQSKKLMDHIEWDLASNKASIQDSFGLEVKMTKIKPDLSQFDMIIVPGGYGTRPLQDDQEFIAWLSGARDIQYKVSICTGSLLLGAAGFLKNRKATTHFDNYDALGKYCDQVLAKRIVDDGDVITAGAVASSLDLGLYICEKLIGPEKTEIIRKSMDYYPSDFEVLRN